MLISEDMATQHILLACAVLRTDIEDITVEKVWRTLIKMWNYEYPREVIAKVINEQSSYRYNWQAHKYEKIEEVKS